MLSGLKVCEKRFKEYVAYDSLTSNIHLSKDVTLRKKPVSIGKVLEEKRLRAHLNYLFFLFPQFTRLMRIMNQLKWKKLSLNLSNLKATPM